MHRRRIYLLTLLTVVSTFVLSVIWEFALEPVVAPWLYGRPKPEDFAERVEYVVTAMFFVVLSLIVPTVMSLRNAGQRDRAETSLRRITNAVEHSHHPVIITDRDGFIEYVNPAFTRITEYDRDYAIGRTPAFLGSGETPPETFDELWDTISAGRSWQGELSNRRRSGEVYVDFVSISPVKDAEDRVISFVGIQQDVTERRQLERERARGQRMEALGQLTGGVAHDFNNLLTVILGNLYFLSEEVGDSQRLQELVGRARTAAARGSDLTHRLLAFARRLPLRATPVDVRDLTVESVALLRRTLGESIDIEMIEPDRQLLARADPAQLQNALVNMGLNARDAMPDGGSIRLEIAEVRLEAADLAGQSDATPGDYVMIAVHDTGRGMTRAQLERVFEPFFTAKGRDGHSGLGLSMVYGFIRQSQGHIAIESAPGAGTTIRLYLPRSYEAVAPPAEAERLELPTGSETVLVVEDDAAVRHVAGRMLRELGYRVVETADGPTALAYADRGDRIDALVSDMVLRGGMKGPELARRLKSKKSTLAVVFTSGHAETANSDAPVDFVAKPYSKGDLAVALRRALDGCHG